MSTIEISGNLLFLMANPNETITKQADIIVSMEIKI
jgi:hypothetical protein